MRALWWSRGPSCGVRIEAREVQGLAVVDGHQVWVCRDCLMGEPMTDDLDVTGLPDPSDRAQAWHDGVPSYPPTWPGGGR